MIMYRQRPQKSNCGSLLLFILLVAGGGAAVYFFILKKDDSSSKEEPVEPIEVATCESMIEECKNNKWDTWKHVWDNAKRYYVKSNCTSTE